MLTLLLMLMFVCLLGENVVKLLNFNLSCDGNFSLVYDDVVDDDFICVCVCVIFAAEMTSKAQRD